jgi:hypothetical protein
MATGDTLQGYRATDGAALLYGPPGGYCLVQPYDAELDGPSADAPRVLWVKDPRGHVARCGQHQVTEHNDGTVTVSPSIVNERGSVSSWHGFLERGVWREA